MASILTPVIVYLIFFLSLSYLLSLCKNMLVTISYKSTEIMQYKLNNVTISMIIVCTYIKFFLIFMYVFRLYNLHRYLDIKIVYKSILSLIKDIFVYYNSNIILLFIIIYFSFTIILLLMTFYSLHTRLYKEIYKIYLYFTYKAYFEKNRYTRKVYSLFKNISNRDFISYTTSKIAYYFTVKVSGKDYDYMNFPWYHIAKIQAKIFVNHKYDFLLKFSPIIFILYDCIFNNLVLSHIYHYLLFYIPLRVLHRITAICGPHSYYMGNLMWEMYYKKEYCLYAISDKYKPFFDDYMISGLSINFNLGSDAELFLYHHVRFVLIDEENCIYKNIHGVELYCKENKVYELCEDEDNDTYYWREWYLLCNKTYSRTKAQKHPTTLGETKKGKTLPEMPKKTNNNNDEF